MLGLLISPSKKVSPSRSRFARLCLEHLERRDTPSSLTMSLGFSSGNSMTVCGDLTDTSNLANQQISITGAVSGSTFTDANGNFSFAVPSTTNGTIYTQTSDGSSNLATLVVTGSSSSSSSTLTLLVAYGSGTTITLSGNLSNTATPSGQTINITGKASGSTTTDSNGNYSVTLQASGLGNVYAQTADGSSNQASVTLTDTAPRVFNFGGSEDEGNLWEFTGTVTWNRAFTSMPGQLEASEGSTIGSNYSVTFTSDGTITNGVATGSFDVVIQLNGKSSDNGSVLATATDPWGQVSNEACFYVYQTGT
jgi:hypothetical protein